MQQESVEGRVPSRSHFVRAVDEPYVPPAPAVHSWWVRFVRLLGRLVDGRTPGDWNTTAPRGYDGERRFFFFNGNGMGR